jgi:lipopolysaccharide/colanic/teichoic acid biosynthesis glycosyltransferase
MSVSPKLRASERAPAEEAAVERHDPPESLAARYARMAHRGFQPRFVDVVLRGLDVVVSLVALIVLSPLLLLIAGALRLAAGNPVLYRGSRVGRAGRIFTMYKFRTLTPDAEVRLGPYLGEELTLRTRTEMTPVGRVLRATHFDELPQLINVLIGDMAIVGPRPIRPAFFEELCEQVPQYWQRLVVRPGMTGFAQLRITREMSWAEKLAHDLEFIADRSIGLYLRVVAATAWRVATRFGQGLRALLRGRG